MVQPKSFLTPGGLEQLQSELAQLKNVRRQEVAGRIHKATESGGTADNAEYEEAKTEQAFVEGRIREIENILANSIVASHSAGADRIEIGSSVKVTTSEGDKEEYQVVGKAEASPLDGKISNESPVGRALMGHKVGDEVEVQTPSKVLRLTITSVS